MISGSDMRPVQLVVDIPQSLVADVEDVSRSDPEYLGRVIQYALARRIIFQELSGEARAPRLEAEVAPSL